MFLYQGRWKQIPSFCSSLICAKPPWSLHSDRGRASLRYHPPTAARQQSGQRSAAPLINQPVVYLCLRPVSGLGYREHVSAGPFAVQPEASLFAPQPSAASPLEPPGGESSSGECLAREGGRGVEVQKLDANPLWQCWTSDDPFLWLLTLGWAQQLAVVSGLMFASWPAATQTTENTTWCLTLPTCLHGRRLPAAAEISGWCEIYCKMNACASNGVVQAPTYRSSDGSPCLPAAHSRAMPVLQQWPVSTVVSETVVPSRCQSEGVKGLSWSCRPDSLRNFVAFRPLFIKSSSASWWCVDYLHNKSHATKYEWMN